MKPRDLIRAEINGEEHVFSVIREALETVADELIVAGYFIVSTEACDRPHMSPELWCINCGYLHSVDEHRFIRIDVPITVQCRKCHEYYDTRP